MTTIEESPAKLVSPEQQLRILKLILGLRSLGDTAASEKLRNRVRKALQGNEDEDTVSIWIDRFCRDAERTQSRLDGTFEKKRAEKRARLEARTLRASRYVDAQAEVGEEDSDEEEQEEEN